MAATTRSRVTIVEFTSEVKHERATRCEAEEANNEVLFINNNIANQVTSSAEVYHKVVNHRNGTTWQSMVQRYAAITSYGTTGTVVLLLLVLQY